MDLNELLSYKPHRKGGEKRPLEEGQGDRAPPSKAPRQKLTSEKLSRPPDRVLPNLAAPLAQDSAELDMNGISDEEKLKLLLSMEDKDEDQGE